MKRPDRPSRRGFLGSLRRAEEAATLAFTAVALGVLLGSAALAVDLGMLIASRVQSQRAADSGALAGASRLVNSAGTADDARQEAKLFANKHNVLTNPVTVQDGDVDVDMTERRVRVRVNHQVPTLFARVMGIDEVTVSTVAAAEVQPAGKVDCPLPIAAIDNWEDWDHEPASPSPDTEGNGQWDGEASPANEYYEPCVPDDDGNVSPSCTGFRVDDAEKLIEVKSAPSDDDASPLLAESCEANTSPGWLCWIQADGGGGAAAIKDIIRNNCGGSAALSVAMGEPVNSEPGNVQSAVREIRDVINENGGTSVEWNATEGCVADVGTNNCRPEYTDMRVRAVPLVDPSTLTGSGDNSTAVVSNMAGAYLEKVAQCPEASCPHKANGGVGGYNVYIRLVEAAANAVGRGSGQDDNTLLKFVVLVE